MTDIDMNTNPLAGHYKKHTERTYLGSHDLMDDSGNYREFAVTISGVHKRAIFNPASNSNEFTIVATFKETKKDMILNETNKARIASIAGSALVQEWIGKKITLTVERVKGQGGKMVDAVRVKVK